MHSTEIALNKATQEIENNIHRIKELCKKFSFGELAYCLYYVHTIRTLKHTEIEQFTNMSIDRYDDVLKHTISCIFKYSNISMIPKLNYTLDLDKSILITKISNHIHTLHEMSSYFAILDDVELIGERNQHVKIDFSKITDDPMKKKAFEYSARFQRTISQSKSKPLLHVDLLNEFATKYAQYDSISNNIFGLTIEEVKTKLNELLNIYIEHIQNNEKNMPTLENGVIDIHSIETLREVVKGYIIDEETILNIFGKKGMKFIRQFTFKKSDFKSHELNYHYILRKPFLKIKNKYIVVPELLLDSLLTNFHYTLLENKNHSEEHKKIMSDIFVDKISTLAQQHGFHHYKSNLDLYQGKSKLGDIDLILRNDEYDYDILIEAKNHTVPLSVYFGEYQQINHRLKELQKDWESKVDKRNQHLLENYEKYGINKNFKYLIVSRYPEILSHYSDYLVLSTNELDFYLRNNAKYTNFYDLYHDLYDRENWDDKEIETFMKETLSCRLIEKESATFSSQKK
ncbi:MAG: hypothetical protein PHW29_08690 [Flavobacterium sp.]|nr:hypothetical protein [Flavobacterium sp.]